MWKFKKIGFVSVELVIMAAIILTSGIAGIVVMGDKGSQAMKDGMDKLASLGIFGGEVVTPSFSSTWYHPSLNIAEEDVNATSDFVFVLNPDGTTYTITDYTNMADKTVVIPKFHNDGKTITGIGEYSFQAMGLTSVALHNAINSIGDYAFEGNELEVLYFSDYAVASMPKRGMVLTSAVSTPSTGLVIGAHAFANNKLTEVQLANGLVEVGASAFENNTLTTVTFPSTTKELGSKAFFSNQITEVTLPASITSLGDYTFKNNGLSAVTFEGTLPAVLGTDIFGANDGLVLRTVKVPSGQLNTFKSAATLLGVQTYALYDPAIPHDPKAYDGTWYDASLKINEADINPVSDFTFTFDSIASTYTVSGYVNATDKTVVIPKYHTDGNLIVGIGVSVFQGKSLTSVALSNGLTTIGLQSFYNNQLTSLIIPSTVVNIGSSAFASNKLTSVTFLGPLPASYSSSSFSNNPFTTGSVKVPSAYLTSYKSTNIIDNLYHYGIIDGDENLEGGLGYQWEPTLNGWEVFHYQDRTVKNMVIPATRLDGKPIVSIGDKVFEGARLTSLTLNEGLKTIKTMAFDSNSLTALVIPNSLTTIEQRAFYNNQITSLIIPSALKAIGQSAFASNKLTSVTFLGPLPASYSSSSFLNNPFTTGSVKVPSAYLTSYKSTNIIDNLYHYGIIDGDENLEGGLGYQWEPTLNGWEVFHYQDRTVKNVIIPATRADGKPVVSIAREVFMSGGLTSLTLNEGLKTIKTMAFDSNSLTALVIPNSLTTIEQRAFYKNQLASLTIPSTVTNIGSSAFASNKLTSVAFLGAIPATNGLAIFSSNPSLLIGSVKVPSAHLSSYQSITSWGVNASAFNILEDDVNLEGGLGYQWEPTLNGWEVFYYQDRTVKNVIIPATRADGKPIVSVASKTFYEAGLTGLTLSEGLKRVGSDAFSKNSITELVLPNGLTTIGVRAFSTNQLTTLTIPSTVTNIEGRAFESNKLTSVTFLGAKPTTLGGYNFSSNPSLLAGSVKVPSVHLGSYQAFTSWGILVSAFVGY